MPGVKDPKRILNILGTTAQLYFRPVLCGAPAYTGATTTKAATKPTKGAKPSKGTSPPATYEEVPSIPRLPHALPVHLGVLQSPRAAAATTPAATPSTPPTRATRRPRSPSTTSTGTTTSSSRLGRPGLTPTATSSGPRSRTARSSSPPSPQLSETGQWEVDLRPHRPRHDGFQQDRRRPTTTTLVANDLDGDIVSAPLILATSFPGSGQITGNFNSVERRAPSPSTSTTARCRCSSTAQTSQAVSPSLGKSSLARRSARRPARAAARHDATRSFTTGRSASSSSPASSRRRPSSTGLSRCSAPPRSGSRSTCRA